MILYMLFIGTIGILGTMQLYKKNKIKNISEIIEEYLEQKISYEEFIDGIIKNVYSLEYFDKLIEKILLKQIKFNNLDVCNEKNIIALDYNKKIDFITYLLEDLKYIIDINHNPLVINKINIREYLKNLKSKEIPFYGTDRYSMTFKEFLNNHTNPMYNMVVPYKIICMIEQTYPINESYLDYDCIIIQKNDLQVRSHSLYNISNLLKNTNLMLEYLGEHINSQIQENKIIYNLIIKIYQQIFPKLPHDILCYIYEFVGISWLPITKPIELTAKISNYKILKQLQNEFTKIEKKESYVNY